MQACLSPHLSKCNISLFPRKLHSDRLDFRLYDSTNLKTYILMRCFGCFQSHQGLPVGLFCSGIQFYLLLNPYLCFIYFLYFDLYVLGNDAFIS